MVIGESSEETKPVFIQKSKEMDAPICFADDDKEVLWSGINRERCGRIYKTKKYGTLIGDLEGEYQEKNMNTVLCAVRQLVDIGIIKDDPCESIRQGTGNVGISTGLCGRWQKLRECPAVVCDTGHNVAGWEYISRQLAMQECRRLHIVFGMVDDKDIDRVMDMLPRNAVYYWTQATSKRAVPAGRVAAIGGEKGLRGKSFENVGKAFSAAMSDASDDDFVFVGGSSYVVADLLALRNGENIID